MPPTPLLSYLVLQRALDRDIMTSLRTSAASIDNELRRLQGRTGVGAAMRAEQLKMTQIAMNREMERLWTNVGNLTEAHKAAAAAAGAESMLDKALLSSVFGADVDYLTRSAREAARQGLRTAEERLSGSSHVPLAQSVYDNQALASGKIDEIINAALTSGASAADLAKSVRAYVNPNTPGGVRYASMRLGRSELNNAFHASQIRQAQESPWTLAVKWNLSGSHPVPDECNVYADDTHFTGGEAGQFKPTEAPGKPHPNCLCYTTTEDVSRAEFIRQFEQGKYDTYLDDLGVPAEDMQTAIVRASHLPTSAPKPMAAEPPKFPTMEAEPRQAYRALERQRPGGVYGDRSPGLEYYKGYGYTPMNSYARTGKAVDSLGKPVSVGKVKTGISSLDGAFKRGVKMPLDTTVQRGMKELDISAYVPGEFVVEAGYSSTTMSSNIADRFARGTLMGDGPGDGWVVEILLPRGTNTVVSGNRGGEEYEILLARNTKFKVHAVDTDRKKIWMEVVK